MMVWFNHYKNLTQAERELLTKLILCTIVGTLFSWAIGDVYSPTTAITANLFLYCDRGYIGSLRYGTKRVLVQIIQGFLVLIWIIPCKYFGFPVPDAIIIMLASGLAICIGLPNNYRHEYSPLNCTLANASFIIACASVHNITAFPYRVLECVMGYAIGYLINYIIIPPKNRYQEAVRTIEKCAKALILEENLDLYQQNRDQLKNELKILIEDSEKGSKKYRLSGTAINLLFAHDRLLSGLEEYKSDHHGCCDYVDNEFLRLVEDTYECSKRLHLSLVQNIDHERIEEAEIVIPPELKPVNHAEIRLAASLIKYVELLTDFLDTTL